MTFDTFNKNFLLKDIDSMEDLPHRFWKDLKNNEEYILIRYIDLMTYDIILRDCVTYTTDYYIIAHDKSNQLLFRLFPTKEITKIYLHHQEELESNDGVVTVRKRNKPVGRHAAPRPHTSTLKNVYSESYPYFSKIDIDDFDYGADCVVELKDATLEERTEWQNLNSWWLNKKL